MTKKVTEHIGFHFLLTKITVVCSDYFGVEYIPQKVLNKITDKSITQNTFRIQDNESIMCGFYCIVFIEYIFDGKAFLDYTNLYIYINIYIFLENITRRKKNEKFWNFFETHYINMADTRRETYQRNGIETIIDNDGMLWLMKSI